MRRFSFGVTLLMVVVLFFAASALARAAQAVQKWSFLQEILPIWPGYLVLHGMIWGVGGVAVALGLFAGHIRALHATPVVIVLYSINFWLERSWLALTTGNAAQPGNAPFIAGINLLVFLWSVWELWRFRRLKRREERYEQQPQD